MSQEPGDGVLDVADVRGRVDKRLGEFLSARTPALEAISPELSAFSDTLGALAAGGKRLRAAFAYWGWRAAGAPDSDAALAAATSLELLHLCALVHDDVMDGSDTRRGGPSAHRRFEAVHTRHGWNGSASVFGAGAALLLGDLCLAWADDLLFDSGLASAALLRGKPLYDAMRTELMAGQYLDLLEQAGGRSTVAGAMTVARYKSAKYTVERPLQLGGAWAGADDELLATYSAYGLPLGEAFQLRDDVLGVFGDPRTTGKPAGDDVREGKRTLLVAYAYDRATPAQRAVLDARLGDPDLDDAGVREFRDAVSDSGALAVVETRIADLTELALAALGTGTLPEPAADVLDRLAHAATSRSR